MPNGTHSNTIPEPIAIVGIGCRFPGGADSPAAFWSMLCAGVDAIGAMPPDRFPQEMYDDSMPSAPGKIATRQGGFLERIDEFDAQFFGISPREANSDGPPAASAVGDGLGGYRGCRYSARTAGRQQYRCLYGDVDE